MSNRYIFSSESVGEGHPDKVADTISDAVLDACLAQDKFSRVACETYVKSNIAIIGGEITTKAKLDFVALARKAIREIGYVNDDDVFHADKVFVNVIVTQQSPDIAQGVDARKAKGKKTAKQGAGDQGHGPQGQALVVEVFAQGRQVHHASRSSRGPLRAPLGYWPSLAKRPRGWPSRRRP